MRFSLTADRDHEPAIGWVRRGRSLSQREARALFASGKVYLDDALCLDPRQPVPAGAVVSVDTDRRAPRKLCCLPDERILYRDGWLVVVDKPAGLVSVPPTRTGEPTLLDLLEAGLARLEGRPVRLVPLHRLDFETSGLMAFGRQGADLTRLQEQFKRHEVERTYLALVAGRPEDGLLAGDIDVTRSRFRGRPQSRFARTRIRVLEAAGPVSLVECRPETGRFHQLRIQLANAGHPILGEREHLPPGYRSPLRAARLMLRSSALSLRHPDSGQKMSWIVARDAEMLRLLDIAGTSRTTGRSA
jgi:23S rRNA pseudouridine1911/1915/1917 synthase